MSFIFSPDSLSTMSDREVLIGVVCFNLEPLCEMLKRVYMGSPVGACKALEMALEGLGIDGVTVHPVNAILIPSEVVNDGFRKNPNIPIVRPEGDGAVFDIGVPHAIEEEYGGLYTIIEIDDFMGNSVLIDATAYRISLSPMVERPPIDGGYFDVYDKGFESGDRIRRQLTSGDVISYAFIGENNHVLHTDWLSVDIANAISTMMVEYIKLLFGIVSARGDDPVSARFGQVLEGLKNG